MYYSCIRIQLHPYEKSNRTLNNMVKRVQKEVVKYVMTMDKTWLHGGWRGYLPSHDFHLPSLFPVGFIRKVMLFVIIL